jgi:SAM-dependent methyltransferase
MLSDLTDRADFALVYAVLHEASDRERFLGEVYHALKKGGILFFGEPSGPVSRDFFREETAMIEAAGFAPVAARHRSSGMNAVFIK